MTSAPVLVFAPDVAEPLAVALDATGYAWKATGPIAGAAYDGTSWAGIIAVGHDLEDALAFCRRRRQQGASHEPILLCLPEGALVDLRCCDDLFDDFVVLPGASGEIEARLGRLLQPGHGDEGGRAAEHGGVLLDLATYRARAGERTLDLTYMEYELLKHFVTNPGRVLSRQELLRDVWGYLSTGRTRTLDAHACRLRKKLGRGPRPWVVNVRGVGYKLTEAV